ncbi:MAG: DUF4855 domain-containing protein [Armatimonadota bacterium]|nr:DUF4855 domain-containing protein [Armatimonadota bacterium]
MREEERRVFRGWEARWQGVVLGVLALVVWSGARQRAYGQYPPPGSPAAGGLRDVMLIYQGSREWTRDRFLPYVAYVDREGRPRAWFYDSFLFLQMGGSPSGADYMSGPTNRADWEHFLNTLFAPERGVLALSAAVDAVGEILRDSDHVCPVILMVPYPSPKVTDFGDVDGDGASEDLSQLAGRVKVIRWFLNNALHRWGITTPRRLRLWGFYWMNEGVGQSDAEVVRATAALVHERGVQFLWIPWFRAPGYTRWRDLGFDVAIIQPNYAFMDQTGSALLADQNRLTINALDAASLGMGVEIEAPYTLLTDPAARWVFRQYLNHGVDELDGTMRGSVRAHYQGYDAFAALAASTLSVNRALYDDLYAFARGRYQRRRTSLVEGFSCRVEEKGKGVLETGHLTDGRWLARPGQEGAMVPVRSGRAVLTLRLDRPTVVDDVRVHLAARGDEELPDSVRVSVLGGGGAFEVCGDTDHVAAAPVGEWLAGFAIVHFPATVARALRIEIAGPPGSLHVGEVVVPPPVQPLWGAAYTLEGEVIPAQHNLARLTDPLVDQQAVRWRRGPAEVSFAGLVGLASQVRVVARSAASEPVLFIRPSPAEAWVQGRVSWRDGSRYALRVDTGLTEVRDLQVRVAGKGELQLEEIVVVPRVSLARGCAYEVEPPFTARYPDSGGELTDRMLTEQGFVDGRTVGWHGVAPTVVVDLEREYVLDRVRAHVQGGGYAAVNFPRRLSVAVSSDGVNWRRVGGTREPVGIPADQRDDGRSALAWMEVALRRTPARWVRLSFDGVGWTMLSEVECLQGEVNVAAGRGYRLVPPPTSEAKYADDGKRLTDGIVTRGPDGWRHCVGWNMGNPAVTVDLGRTHNLRMVRAHLVGGGSGGAFFPSEMVVTWSTDGRTWSAPVTTTERPVESGNAVLPGYMTVRLASDTRARWLRISFVCRTAWCMVDEIEVY